MKPILIRGGRVVDPSTGVDAERDLLLKDGRVAAIEAPGKLNGAARQEPAELIDAKGLIVAPGLVDIHVHLREPGQGYKETIASGTAAAAAGGFTAVCAMPNTIPVNDSPEITRWMQSPERGASIRVFPIAAATRGSMGEALTEYGALKAAGAVGVTDDGKPILGDSIMRQALSAAGRIGLPVIQHAEDTRMTGGCSMNAGALAFRLGLRGMPVEAESSLVERDIRLLAELKDGRAHLHVAHLSTSKALEAVKKARRNGLQTALGLTMAVLHGKHKLPVSRIIALLSTQPANVLGLKGRGSLAAGSFADVVIFDPKKEWTFQASASKSRSKNTPFDGWKMLGSVAVTISEGRIAFRA
jgi:dihydroorotase